MGTPNGALDDLGVGTGDDFGNGLFYSWYGPPNAPNFAMADSYDGDTPRQKLAYETPSFAGFKAGFSYQPSDVPLDHSTSLTTGVTDPTFTTYGLARNRIEAAVQLNRAFGPVGVKADVGYAYSGWEHNAAGIKYQDVSYFNVGGVATIAGIEIEGSVSSGKWNIGSTAGMSPGSPSPAGSKDSTVYTGGVGYNMGPFGIGAVYYGAQWDDSESTGVAGHTDSVNGEGIAGSYAVGPGVTLQLDAYTYETKLPSEKTRGNIIALASLFAF